MDFWLLEMEWVLVIWDVLLFCVWFGIWIVGGRGFMWLKWLFWLEFSFCRVWGEEVRFMICGDFFIWGDLVMEIWLLIVGLMIWWWWILLVWCWGGWCRGCLWFCMFLVLMLFLFVVKVVSKCWGGWMVDWWVFRGFGLMWFWSMCIIWFMGGWVEGLFWIYKSV